MGGLSALFPDSQEGTFPAALLPPTMTHTSYKTCELRLLSSDGLQLRLEIVHTFHFSLSLLPDVHSDTSLLQKRFPENLFCNSGWVSHPLNLRAKLFLPTPQRLVGGFFFCLVASDSGKGIWQESVHKQKPDSNLASLFCEAILK